MATSTGLTAEEFNQLLGWLGEDRDAAARRYEQIRSRLIKIFVCRGCSAAEELADRTIDRVATKIQQIAAGYQGEPALYFYGVAEKIYLEHVKASSFSLPPSVTVSPDEVETKYQCLEGCMDRLPARNRELILAYYGENQEGTMTARKDLAERFGLGANALWIRAHRIREGLRKCVSDCFKSQGAYRQNVKGNGAWTRLNQTKQSCSGVICWAKPAPTNGAAWKRG